MVTTKRLSATLFALLFLPLFGSESSFAKTDYIDASRPTADTAGVKAVLEPVLKTIPTNVRDAVFDYGLRIMVVPTVAEYIGANYSDKPRGYLDGGGYDNADGLFMPAKNQLLVSEKVSFRNSAPGKSSRIPYVVRHEFGHAFDYYLGKHYKGVWAITTQHKFAETYAREAQRLTNSQRATLAYFCQAGDAGASETFAELFCIHCTPSSEWSSTQRALMAAFPSTDTLVKTAMNSPEAASRWAEQ